MPFFFVNNLLEYSGYHGDDVTCTFDESGSRLETDTVVSTESECIICVATGKIQCDICGGTVWVCSEQCKRWHESEAGHTRGSIETVDLESTLESFPMSDVSFNLIYHPMEALLDVVFGRNRPSCSGARTIDFRSLDESDLRTLREMVLTEFNATLLENIHEHRPKSSNDTPRTNDVFLMENGELAVCRPYADGDLMWFDKDGIPASIDSTMPIRRVASLSGVLRVLESLVAIPASGSLMERAMKRDVVRVAATTKSITLDHVDVDYLNESQRQVVKTVLSMQSGILAVQGPPVRHSLLA